MTIDVNGRVLLANEAAHRLLGFDSEPLRGQAIGSYVPSLHSIVSTQSSRVLRTTLQCPGRRKTGEAFLAGVWFSTYTTLNSPRLAAIIVDVSEDLRNREDLSAMPIPERCRLTRSSFAGR